MKTNSELTSRTDKESRFHNDQLIERVMVKEMGKGIREIEIWFDYPITVTQRFDEGLLTHKNFTN